MVETLSVLATSFAVPVIMLAIFAHMFAMAIEIFDRSSLMGTIGLLMWSCCMVMMILWLSGHGSIWSGGGDAVGSTAQVFERSVWHLFLTVLSVWLYMRLGMYPAAMKKSGMHI